MTPPPLDPALLRLISDETLPQLFQALALDRRDARTPEAVAFLDGRLADVTAELRRRGLRVPEV